MATIAWVAKLKKPQKFAVRYRNRCDLYLYSEAQVRQHFERATKKPFTIQRLERDFFVTLDCR